MGWEASLARALHVTRVARVTGLDRTGVSVACAIRPGGHVLQVANGKGTNESDAVLSALAEAAELSAAEEVDVTRLCWGSFDALRRQMPARSLWPPDRLGSAGELDLSRLWSPAVRLAWFPATELMSGAELLVPAQALFCQAEGGVPLGPQLVRWSTNGMGAHADLGRATLHALLEALERDQLARVVPTGWTRALVRQRRIAPDRSVPRTRRLARSIARRGFEVFLFDLTAARGPGLPVAGALLADKEGSAIPLTAGYACRLHHDDALEAALLEAAQSRLTDVHGAREDVEPMDAVAASQLRAMCLASRSAKPASQMPSSPRRSGLDGVLASLRAAGHRRVARAELSRSGSALRVAKVIVPSFRTSALL